MCRYVELGSLQKCIAANVASMSEALFEQARAIAASCHRWDSHVGRWGSSRGSSATPPPLMEKTLRSSVCISNITFAYTISYICIEHAVDTRNVTRIPYSSYLSLYGEYVINIW